MQQRWYEKYLLAKKYYEEHGNLLIPATYEVISDGKVVKLGLWIANQRRARRGNSTGKLSEYQIKLLDDIGMVWDIKHNFSRQTDIDWFTMYDLAKKYYEEHGNLLIPTDYKVDIDGKIYDIHSWVKEQRRTLKNYVINKEKNKRVDLLNEIGMIWDVSLYISSNYSNEWYERYLLAKKYYEEHGDLLIPYDYEIIVNGNVIKLGNWINSQRRAYRNLIDKKSDHFINDEQIRLLNEIGMVWNQKEYNNRIWFKRYLLVKEYYEKHGNLLIPYDYYVIRDGKRINIGTWIVTQRQLYKKGKLSEEQIKLLEDVKMVWNLSVCENSNYSPKWYENYLLAKKYYENNGDLLIPQNYYVIKDGKKIHIGTWINTQRELYKKGKLNEVQIKLLEDIKMIWDLSEYEKNNYSSKWYENYLVAKEYFEKNGNLLVSQSYFEVKDGKEIFLGTWLNSQRMLYKKGKLSEIQIKLLEEINMVWNVKEYNKINSFVEEKYLLYELGQLKDYEVNALVNDGYFIYKDDSIVMGNSYVLTANKVKNNRKV